LIVDKEEDIELKPTKLKAIELDCGIREEEGIISNKNAQRRLLLHLL
jgi:hypothetical protein